MKEYLKQISATTILIAYLFVCGGLYLIGFWGTFSVDMTAFIQIWDIPKSFILPFTVTSGITLLYDYVRFVFFKDYFFQENIKKIPFVSKETGDTIVEIFHSVLLISIFFLKIYWGESIFFFPVSGFIIGINIIYQIGKSSQIKKIIPNIIVRQTVIKTLVFVPIVSFVLGKNQSQLIYTNSKMKYINTINNTMASNNFVTNSMKFLGFLGDKVIISSLDNKKIIVLNQSAYDGIELLDSLPVIKKTEIKSVESAIPVDTTTR